MIRARDVARVVEACLAGRASGALLCPENLAATFFDLSSAEAGKILEKLARPLSFFPSDLRSVQDLLL
jgi:hypothetical protein